MKNATLVSKILIALGVGFVALIALNIYKQNYIRNQLGVLGDRVQIIDFTRKMHLPFNEGNMRISISLCGAKFIFFQRCEQFIYDLDASGTVTDFNIITSVDSL